MKHLLLGLILLVGLNTLAQQKSKVQKVNGVEVYLLAEPIREYEVVKTTDKGIQWGSALTGGLINESIATKVAKYVRKLGEEYKEKNIDFDAVIYSNGKQMTAIKFIDEKTAENDGVAIVQTIEGIPFFVMSKPIDKYEFVKSIGGGIKWKSAVTGGLINNSIEQDLMKFAKKMSKKFRKNQISAIVYDRGKKATAIKFVN